MGYAYQSLGEELFWEQRYRPTTLSDVVLAPNVFKILEGIKVSNVIPNVIFGGPAGTGKTTSAWALCEDLKYEYITINGSDAGRKIDTIRTTVHNFSSTVALTGARKCVIFDEGDYLAADTVQPALRHLTEQFSSNCSFIITCNYKSRFIEPILSRFSYVDFTISGDDLDVMSAKFFKRVCHILETEKVEYDRASVAQVVKRNRPDWRRTLKELQKYSNSGRIDEGILSDVVLVDIEPVVAAMKDKNYKALFEWCFKVGNFDMVDLCRDLLDEFRKDAQPQTIPHAVIIMAQYQQSHVTAIDPTINILAMLTSLMLEVKFK